MTIKQHLSVALLSLSFIGTVLAAYPFLASLSLSEKAIAELPQLRIDDMRIGSFKIVKHPKSENRFRGYEDAIMLVKKNNGDVNAWHVRVKDGAIGMPDYNWWVIYYSCKQFGPTLVNGLLDEASPIACHVPTESMYGYAKIWRWSIDGIALNPNVANMEKAKGHVKGKFFILGRNH